MTDAIRRQIVDAARAHGLDPLVVEALVLQESSGNPYAWRPEPAYRYLVDCRTGLPFRACSPDELRSTIAPPDFPTLAGTRDQEWWAQRASLGLCQIMGAVAREQGFREPYLLALCEPATNLRIGCQILKGHLEWARGDLTLALAAYNAGRAGAMRGGGRAYADQVLARYARLRAGGAA